MIKQKTVFVCQQCGTEFPKWMGKCLNCGEWNALVETATSARSTQSEAKPQKLSQIKSIKRARIQTKSKEFDRILGGGLVPGSVVLLAGEPGIGKSTLMLQLAGSLADASSSSSGRDNQAVLYISGEESLEQIKMRAKRLGIKSKNLLFLAETDVDAIIKVIEKLRKKIIKEKLIIVDSIQTITTEEFSGTAGSVGQIRECTARLLRIAKSYAIPIFLIGHITKAGAIAGPKILEHMVDTVLYFEGEKFASLRLLRATKNRFGAVDEVGVFEMTDQGMKAVDNPSKLFLAQRAAKVPGSVVVATIEGTRPVLAEIQALVVSTQLPVPRRVAQGLDYNRLQLIVAVLTKRLGLPLATFDVFANVTGGLRIEEPAADLAVALAIISSFKNVALDPKAVCFGELGLLGEIRVVNQAEKRKKEARRLGFTTIISPAKFSSIKEAAKKVLFKK